MHRAAVLLLACACTSNGSTEMPPARDLVREGTTPSIVRKADLDGDGTLEVIVASFSAEPNSFGLPTPYLEVFAERDGEWRRAFDATGHAPPGKDAPGVMLEPGDENVAVAQTVDVLEASDLAHDEASELVVAISNVGATTGPLELWIVSMGLDGAFMTELYERTERGGKVSVMGDRVAIEFGVYKRKDPGCCPSSFEVQAIGYDPEQGLIRVLERERHPLENP